MLWATHGFMRIIVQIELLGEWTDGSPWDRASGKQGTLGGLLQAGKAKGSDRITQWHHGQQLYSSQAYKHYQ